ncbi:MAG: gluconate 2-dehydrogenase subunit 3 family protein [Xanthomonadales bacterium]|nr:gluconate 2-dehydrogenase subunit 3 family protein [Xanthomonadales bacterium]
MTLVRNSRRDFLKSGGTIMSASWLGINMPLILSASQTAAENKAAEADFQNISIEESVELSALVNQIIPADETPDATGIGVVYFIDVALGGFMNTAAPMLRQGLEELRQKIESAFPGESLFSGLSSELQTEMLKSVEDTPLFGMLHFMTLCGMFCLPSYTGNRENAGWDLIDFDHRHAWQPPFGYYDAAVHGQDPVEGDELENV